MPDSSCRSLPTRQEPRLLPLRFAAGEIHVAQVGLQSWDRRAAEGEQPARKSTDYHLSATTST